MTRNIRDRKARFLSVPVCAAARRAAFELLEGRQLLAAHVVGDSTSYATIQAAVNAAPAGATINVDAGTYNEEVTISKELTIRGAQAGVDARGNARLNAASTTETIIDGVSTAAGRTPSFLIKANDVTIDGFMIQGNSTSDISQEAGLIIGPNQHGTHVLYNIFQNNCSGMFLANDSSTDPALIQFNVFRNNNNPGQNGGRGIYTNQDTAGKNLTAVVIDSNFFQNNFGSTGTTKLESAISFESQTKGTQTNFTITNNAFDGDGKGVLAFNLEGMTIKNNIISNSLDQYSGTWRFEGDVHNVTIQFNDTINNTGPAVNVDSKGYAGNSSGFVVTNNNFFGNSSKYTNKVSLKVGAGNYDGVFDARNNYWGAANGPGGVQAGSGDVITTNGNNVLYSAWATAPVVTSEAAYYGLPFSAGAVIQVEDFDQGGEGIAYHDSDKTNTGGKYRATGIDMETTTDTGGGYDIGWSAAGEWMKYTVNVTQTGTYNFDFRVANTAAGAKFHLEVDGVNVTGTLTMPNTGGTQKWQTMTKTGIAMTAGTHVLRLVDDAKVGNFNWIRFTNAAAVPAAATNLMAVAVADGSVALTWKDNATNETGYKIERSLDGVNFTPVTTAGANATSYSDPGAGLTAGTMYWYRVRSTNASGDGANSNVAYAMALATTVTPPSTPPTVTPAYLSDLTWDSATVGWGDIHLDADIKGTPISLRGATYAKGIGTHAVSDITYNLNGVYSTFTSDIGVDDDTFGQGAVSFQVIADGKVIFDSGVLSGTDPVVHVNLKIAGVKQLTLQATNGVDGSIDYDHADWAGAMVS
ncbi:MAG TPA: NPCBM/NEW2 domain-containing protein [Tepidisphaeraceae bacterium]|jgi:hypothetical protein|nr:NPCBM/NEW2 domain-containing protein [Tepidisphaeraceae bacterium]